MTLRVLVNEYVTKMRNDNNPRTTIKSYGSRIRAFILWLEATGATPTVIDFNYEVLYAWITYRTNKGDRPRTRTAHIDALRNFGKWMVEKKKCLEANPAMQLDKPQLDAAEREHITDEEVQAYLVACDRLADARRAAMGKAVLSIFTYCAIRRTELMNLRLNDVVMSEDGRERRLIVRNGKGQKTRETPLISAAHAAIIAWRDLRGTCKHDFLFAIDHNRRLGDVGLRTLLRDIAAAAEMRGAKNFLPHSIRHNTADRMHRNNAPMRDIQALLGHERLATTEVYLREGSIHLFQVAEDKLGFKQPAQIQPIQPHALPITPPAQREINQSHRQRISMRSK